MNRDNLESYKKSDGLTWLAIAGVGALTAYNLLKPKKTAEYSFAGKTVLITGGSRGLGLVMARMFADEGASVAVCARDGAELERARKDLSSRGAEVFAIVCDVREQTEVVKMVDNVRNRFGQIDVLINNAGMIQVGPLEVQTQEDFEDAMRVHFWGPFYTMREVITEMKERGEGRIVNISSIGGKVAVPHLAPYCASKFALAGLSGAMNRELAKDGIKVTTVCPGLMRTGSHVNALFKGKHEIEYAMFSLTNAFPGASVSAEDAAEEIIEACRAGQNELVISLPAKLAAKINELFPEAVSDIAGLVNQILPGKGGIETDLATGKESASFASPSFLTHHIDEASARNNELEPGERLH